MGKNKEKKKESQLVIRVEKAEKTAFLDLCEALDTSAGRELRRFMRDFVATHATKTTAPDAGTPKSRKAEKLETPAEPAVVPEPLVVAAPVAEEAIAPEVPARKARKPRPTEA